MFRIISVAIYRVPGYPPDQSWVDNSCDTWDSVYGWDRAPCTACTLPNSVRKNIHFEMRGLCDRWHQGGTSPHITASSHSVTSLAKQCF